jgi:hypothetical protein
MLSTGLHFASESTLRSEYAKLPRTSPHIDKPICSLHSLPNSAMGFVSPKA